MLKLNPLIGVISLSLILFSCHKKVARSYTEISNESTRKQIGYLAKICSDKNMDEATIVSYLDSIEITNAELGGTPDSIARVLSLLYRNNKEEVMVIPNSLRISKVDNLHGLNTIVEYRVPVSFTLAHARRTLHLSDSAASCFINMQDSMGNNNILSKYIPGINYEGYESAFTPPIITGISFNRNSDSIRVYTYENYSGWQTTMVRKGNEYSIAESVSDGDF